MREQEFTFRELLVALWNNIQKILLVTILAVFVGGLFSYLFITPIYEASINMIVNNGTNVDGSITNDGITSSEKLVDTYAIIIKGNIVLNQVIENIELNKSYDELNSQVKISSVNGTQVMKISVQDKDLEQAKKIVAAISEIAPSIIIDAVEAGSCKVISEIEASTNPITPDIQKNAIILGILGLLASIIFYVTKALLADYIEDEFDVQRKLGIPVLGIIPDAIEED